MNGEWIVRRVNIVRDEQNMFGEFNDAGKSKTSLAKYSVKFDDFVALTHPRRIPYLRL